ncbi:MAG: hypothetical protein ACRDXX_17420, partial [Stackebrandtia sp.]
MIRRRTLSVRAAALFAVGAVALSLAAAATAQDSAADPAADQTLRVYNNNIENLVVNHFDDEETCTRVTGSEHLSSMLVDDDGNTGTDGVEAPDLLIVQQVRGIGQAQAYADQLSAMFGLDDGAYQAIVAWEDPQEWGGSHHCADPDLGDRKKKQTNGLIYNTERLDLASGDVSKYWSAGWLKPGTDYDDGAGCTLYKSSSDDDTSHDDGEVLEHKWKRTSAIAARFTIKDTETTVFAATMHLPQENADDACAGKSDTGIKETGIHFGADASRLMNDSTIRIVGIDANRTPEGSDGAGGITPSTLDDYGMTGYGSAPTTKSNKIDYLFIKGSVQPSSVDHTVA